MYFYRLVKRRAGLKIRPMLSLQENLFYSRRFRSSEKSFSVKKPNLYMSSKEIRKHFIDYFVADKNHSYVHSSPVFLNNDPSLLFVNAGMNQFKSLLLDKTSSGQEFCNLKRAVNSQKCIRISGKHNDLNEVGHDFHHHTFFEMLGNWSFGDYFKKEACAMAWELLTKVYGLPEEQLYITYFGGDENLNLPPDMECRDIWLEIGVKDDHIFPFGVKENFWDMGETGPCGPCTEIHYDYLTNQNNVLPAAKRLNSGGSDLIEIWNLVFIQYKRDKCGDLGSLLKHNVDTGMGLERLAAILQGTTSNYDTDIFSPLFEAIQKNFNVRPYTGNIGQNDFDGIDTAYRIIADHSRMFTVALSDGLFPDTFDAGHVLRKIIRKAAYMANCVMKTRPGYLSTLVPYVVESLDFFPELEKHTQEVIGVVNDEEKMLHQIINRGRKVRNKMAVEAQNKVLEGRNVWELYNVYGLDEKIIEDLVTEIDLKVDWKGYKKISEEKELKSHMKLHTEEAAIISSKVLKTLQAKNIIPTDDSHKYSYNCTEKKCDIPNVLSNVVAIIQHDLLVNEVKEQESCLLITECTNFYAHAGGQVSDIGEIFNEDFIFNVENVHSLDGYIFHQGKVMKGQISPSSEVTMSVNKEYRHGCMLNHTATHLLQRALRKIFPYTSQRSSHVDPHHLRFGFSAKASLNSEQVEEIEDFVNDIIQKGLNVSRQHIYFEDILNMPNVSVIRGEIYPDVVTAVMIGDKNKPEHFSVEPCCGTHVKNTSDIEKFLVMGSKSVGGSMKLLHAVTGKVAEDMIAMGREFEEKVKSLEEQLHDLEDHNASADEYRSLLKQVRKMLKEYSTNAKIPFRVLRRCEASLSEMRLKLLSFLDLSSQRNQSSEPINESTKLLVSPEVEKYIEEKCILPTIDSYKYNYFLKDGEYYIEPISATVSVIFQNGNLVEKCEKNQQYVILADKTNFYAMGDGQACDQGLISCQDFVFNVTKVYQRGGHVFHEGWVENGSLHLNQNVSMLVDKDHRKQCSQNHTATHLLHSSLKKYLPHIFQLNNLAGPLNLQLNFKAQVHITLDLLQSIEDLVNTTIEKKMNVSRIEVPVEKLKEFCGITLVPGVKYETEIVPVISIGADNSDSVITSVEPCYGTHAINTADLEKFVIISSKVHKNEKVIRAVTGKQAESLLEMGRCYNEEMLELERRISECLQSKEEDCLEMWDLLKEVKIAKNKHETDLPHMMFRKHQDILTEFTLELNRRTESFIQKGFSQVKSEMEDVLKKNENCNYMIHKISSFGDGRRLVNFALKSVPDKPSIFFAIDGHKTIICSCAVPKNYVTASFSALLWIEPVASFLEGRTRFRSKDPELSYSIESQHVNRIDEAVLLAKKYVESNL